MNREVSRLSLPLREVDRAPMGARLNQTEGHINGDPILVTVTATEMHVAFLDHTGPRFAVDFNDLAKETANAVEVLLGRKRGIR